MKAIENLDFYCVDYAKRIVDSLTTGEKAVPGSEISHLATKLLSVLHENGLYAALLFILWKRYNGTRTERRVTSVFEDLLVGKPGQHALLRLEQIGLPLKDVEDSVEVGRTLSRELENLFLAKDLLDRTLVYVRYQAKGTG